MSEFKPGDRVGVNDPALAAMRAIMRSATGQEPRPNHVGTVAEVWDSGDVLSYLPKVMRFVNSREDA